MIVTLSCGCTTLEADLRRVQLLEHLVPGEDLNGHTGQARKGSGRTQCWRQASLRIGVEVPDAHPESPVRRTASALPANAAVISIVWPSCTVLSGSTPASRSRSMMLAEPLSAARYNGLTR